MFDVSTVTNKYELAKEDAPKACLWTGACRLSGICPVHGGRVCEQKYEGLPVIPPLAPADPAPADGAVAICGACGLRLQPVMGYVCSRPGCPVFLNATC